jgi:hypothetical protein
MNMLFAAAAIASFAPQADRAPRMGATAQAIAVVRIVSGVRLRLGKGPISGEAPPLREAIVHTEGAAHSARLIEFE